MNLLMSHKLKYINQYLRPITIMPIILMIKSNLLETSLSERRGPNSQVRPLHQDIHKNTNSPGQKLLDLSMCMFNLNTIMILLLINISNFSCKSLPNSLAHSPCMSNLTLMNLLEDRGLLKVQRYENESRKLQKYPL